MKKTFLTIPPCSKNRIRRSQNLDFFQTWNFQEMLRFLYTSIDNHRTDYWSYFLAAWKLCLRNARKDFSHSFAKFSLQKNDNLLIWMQNFLYSETSSKILKIIYCQKIFFVIVRLENRARKFVGRLHRFRDFLYNGRHLANFSVTFQLNMFLTSSLNGRNNSSSALRLFCSNCNNEEHVFDSSDQKISA